VVGRTFRFDFRRIKVVVYWEAHTVNEQANKATIRLIREQAVSQGKHDILDGLYADDYRYHGGSFGELAGANAFKELLGGMGQVLDGWVERVEAQIAEGDMVLTRLNSGGRVVGELLGVAGGGREVTGTAMVLSRFNERGQVAEEWVAADTFAMLQQLRAAG